MVRGEKAYSAKTTQTQLENQSKNKESQTNSESAKLNKESIVL